MAALNRERSMALNGGRGNQPRASLREKATLNQLKAVAASVSILESSDVGLNVEKNISNGQILVWEQVSGRTSGRFQNADISAIAPGAAIVPRVREIFVKEGGDNSDDGVSTNNALLDFNKGLELMSNFGNGYELLQFWVSGNVNFDTSTNNRLREGSFVGNNSLGISIRGLNSSLNLPELGPTESPRTIGSNLIQGAMYPSGVFTLDSTISDAANGLNTWNSSDVIPETTYFLRDESNNIFPIRVDATQVGIMAGERIFITTSQSSPSTTQAFRALDFPCTITCNNQGVTSEPGFSMDGNVQFIEVHFKLQNNVSTPIHINGTFQALYSMFSNDTLNGTNATLELSASGWGNDPNATSRINPTDLPVAGEKNIRVFSCIFQDLTIKVDSPCDFSDCVFTRCKFSNTIGATFTNCTFYNSQNSSIGSKNDTYHLNNSLSIDKSLIMYTQSGVPFSVSSDAYLSVSNSIVRPLSLNGAGLLVRKTEPLIVTSERGSCNVNNINIPADSGLDDTAGATAVVHCNGGSADVRDLSVVGGAIESSLVSGNNSNIILGSISDTTTGTGPIITAINSTVSIQQFDSTIPNGLANPLETSGLFKFSGSTVTISNGFNIVFATNPSSTTNKNVFHLVNSSLRNSISDDSAENFFNVQGNSFDSKIFDLTTSSVVLETGKPAANSGPQQPLRGGLLLNDYSTLTVNGTAGVSLGDNTTLFTGGVNDHAIELNSGSSVNLTNINLLSVSLGFKLVNKCSLFINNSSLLISGAADTTSVEVYDNSSILLQDTNLQINTSNLVPPLDIKNNSHFTHQNSDPVETYELLVGLCPQIALIENSSSVSLLNVSVGGAAGSGPQKGFVANLDSKVNIHGSVGHVKEVNIVQSGGSGDAAIELTNNSSCNVSYIEFAAAIMTGSILIAQGLCNAYLRNIKDGDNISSAPIRLLKQSKLHMEGTNLSESGTAFTINVGTNVPGPLYSSITMGDKIYPGTDLITDGNGSTWVASQGCVITYT